MTVKTGQKCTAIRRVIVPVEFIKDVIDALGKRLDKTIIGDPIAEGVKMGPLAGLSQKREVIDKIIKLEKSQDIVYGDLNDFNVIGADKNKGAFLAPILFLNEHPTTNIDCHEIESFGPVATIMPYTDIDQAIKIARMGKGSLVCSIVTNDMKIAENFVLGAASMHGRILILNEACAKESTGHGSPMPLLKHGGPGRAGGGEEMGGKRGILHYLQRTAIQGHPTTITSITKQYQYGAVQNTEGIHTFKKHFEDIMIGDTVITEKHLVTLDDIENFADLSGDRFYAHMDENSLEGTIFTERVAHGYFILSKAAGLFVEPEKGPVLLNYGIDECRFIKPVYPGMTIGVRFTAKEKINQEKKDDEDYSKGIVKFLVDVYDDENETVMLATILTMVKKINK
jgi:oxepin-CoA hydrolase/3-oxo-5,6-dehydrosuberyl-CoA semialdehyde dehydrogenase